MIECIDFTVGDKNFSIIVTEPTYDRPVQFSGTEYIRIGENIKKLKDFPGQPPFIGPVFKLQFCSDIGMQEGAAA